MPERGEDWATELWPDDDDWPEFDPDVTHQLYLGTGQRHGSKPRRRRLLRLMTTAVVAIAAGVAGALAVKDISSGSSPPPATQSKSGGANSGGAGLPPADVSGSMLVGGKVTAVSLKSITISAGPQSVTARVTASTRFSGKVTAIADVRVGDAVIAQIAESKGVNSLVALQDPISAS